MWRHISSSAAAALQPGVDFGLLYQLIPLLSISNQFLPILHLEHLHIFVDSIDPSILGASAGLFPNGFQLVRFLTCKLRAGDQKHLESFEMWCWRRMEKISCTDHVRNEEVLLRVSEQRNILHEIRKRKANWIGHILRRNCLLKEVIERKIQGQKEVTRRRGRRRK
jgi:hypothetical protein